MDESDLLRELRGAVEAAEPVEERARRAAELIRARTGRRWVGVYRVAGGRVTNIAWSGPAAPAHPSFPVGRGLTGAAIRARETVVSNDVGADPRYLTNQPTTGSELIVPVLRDGDVVGTLDVEEARRDAFSEDDRRSFERLARALVTLFG